MCDLKVAPAGPCAYACTPAPMCDLKVSPAGLSTCACSGANRSAPLPGRGCEACPALRAKA
eukprot:271860-Chlamydomonas_euryale.AAC.2